MLLVRKTLCRPGVILFRWRLNEWISRRSTHCAVFGITLGASHGSKCKQQALAVELRSSSRSLPLAISAFYMQPCHFKRYRPEIIEFRSIDVKTVLRLIASCEWIAVLLLHVLFLSTIILLAASLPIPLFCSHNNTIYNTIH